ncbi:hypothetical protein HYALB_00003443 [Hymenoscyphus albidus]|uniref:Uncharacterized protein n=1 Tax=Hymenoscyphus albidus TaxID=595503 RepID=A0A9N9LAN3_9HELO|nr:hypothetical protein HYALB_00003443 [Hymenoscyphus albidus]
MFSDAAPKRKLAFTRMIPFINMSPPKTRAPSPPSEAPRAESPTLPSTMKPTQKNGFNRRPVPVAELTIVPYTASEWVKVMEEVKDLYHRKQHKQCSARCIKLLDSIRDPYNVHPLYSITLAFFAASSLEATASPLHNDSPLKLPLFNESLTYYALASSYIAFASFATKPSKIHPTTQGHRSNQSSISSSLRSSVDSIFSQGSTSSCGSSILDSPYSTDSEGESRISRCRSPSILVLTPRPLRPKKRVSFNFEETTKTAPTIANENTYKNTDLLSHFPSPPLATFSPTIIPTTPNYDVLAYASPPSSPSGDTPSLHRYQTHLSSLERQLEYHTTHIKAQIRTVSLIRKARRSNLPDLFPTRPRSGSVSSMTSNSSVSTSTSPHRDSESQTPFQQDLSARIQKIKEGSSRRPRFNPQKYRDLCENVIIEMEQEGWRS